MNASQILCSAVLATAYSWTFTAPLPPGRVPDRDSATCAARHFAATILLSVGRLESKIIALCCNPTRRDLCGGRRRLLSLPRPWTKLEK